MYLRYLYNLVDAIMNLLDTRNGTNTGKLYKKETMPEIQKTSCGKEDIYII